MITVTSNINEFLKNYRKRVGNFKTVLNSLATKLAERMSADMQDLIQKDKRWQERGKLSTITNVDFRQEMIGENTVRVHIGENLPLFEMKDGTLVNPAFFIEFGFGIVGKENPKEGVEKYDWEYNIRGHTSYWWYRYEGHRYASKGREGLNFIYQTLDKYRNSWNKYLKELMTEIGNG